MASPWSFLLPGDYEPCGHDPDDRQGSDRDALVRQMFDADDESLLSRVCPGLRLDGSAPDGQIWLAQYIVKLALRQQQQQLHQDHLLTPSADQRYREAKLFVKAAKLSNMSEPDPFDEQYLTFNPSPGVGGPDWVWLQATLLQKGLEREEVEKRLKQMALEVGKVGYMIPSDIFFMIEFAIPLKECPGLWVTARKLGIKIRRFGGQGAEDMARAQTNRVRMADLHANLRRFCTNVQRPSSEMLGWQNKGIIQIEEERKVYQENMAVVRALEEDYEHEQDDRRAARYKKLVEEQQRLERGLIFGTDRPVDDTYLPASSASRASTPQTRFPSSPMELVSSGTVKSSSTPPPTAVPDNNTSAPASTRPESKTDLPPPGYLGPIPSIMSKSALHGSPDAPTTNTMSMSNSSSEQTPSSPQPTRARIAAAARGEALPVFGPSDLALNMAARVQALRDNGRGVDKHNSTSDQREEDYWMHAISGRDLKPRDTVAPGQGLTRTDRHRVERQMRRDRDDRHQQHMQRQQQQQWHYQQHLQQQLQQQQYEQQYGQQQYGQQQEQEQEQLMIMAAMQHDAGQGQGQGWGEGDAGDQMLLDRP